MAVNACAEISGSFASWGDCFIQAVFWGSPLVASVAIIGTIVFFSWKLNIPYSVSFFMAAGAVFMMALLFPSQEMNALVALMAILITSYIVKGIVKPAQR